MHSKATEQKHQASCHKISFNNTALIFVEPYAAERRSVGFHTNYSSRTYIMLYSRHVWNHRR